MVLWRNTMPLTNQPISYYVIDHTTLDVIVKEDMAGRMPPVPSDQLHPRPHFFLDPFSRLVIAVALDVQAVHSSLSTNDSPDGRS
jgi:hypothetical protein